MSFHVIWDNSAQTIVRHNMARGWTWQGFRDAKKIADMMIDQTPHQLPVGVIFMLPDELHLPPNSIINTRNAIVNRHPRVAALALVTPFSHLKGLYDILVKVYPQTADVCFVVPTLDEARKTINERLAMAQALTR